MTEQLLVGGALLAAAGLLGWIIRVERLLTGIKASVTFHFDGKGSDGIGGRVRRHSDKLQEHDKELEHLRSALEVTQVLKYDPDTLNEFSAMLHSAAMMVERRNKKEGG